MACIINERRAFGRKGVGAVMGSKNLKAIAVRGTKEVSIANEEEFKKARSVMLKTILNPEDEFLIFPPVGGG